MTFDETLAQVRELLAQEGRVSYRALKRRFTLDDEYIEDLKAELIDAKHLAVDKDGKVLVWVPEQSAESKEVRGENTGRDSHTMQHETRNLLAKAHKLLSKVYNWFTEGFDTKDLQEAKTLIEELRH